MKKTIAILISMVLVIAFGTVVFAATEAAAPTEKKAEVKTHRITGEVASVDAAANTVTVKKGKKEVILHITDKTKIMHGKKIADLTVGEKVIAIYVEEEDKNVAKSIKSAEASKAKETKPEEPAKPAESEKK